MRYHLLFTMLALPLLAATLTAQDERAKRQPPDYAKAASDLVTEFFKNWESRKARQNEPMLLGPEATIVTVNQFRGGKHSTKPLSAWLADEERNPPRYLRLDQVQTDISLGSPAIVKARYTGAGLLGRAVFALAWTDNGWRISTVTQEIQFNW